VNGAIPHTAGGIVVHAGAQSRTASLELEGRWLPGTRMSFQAGTISASLASGALVGCARFGAWGLCGLGQAGPLKARGEGYSRSEETSTWVVSLGARAQWEWVFAHPIGLRFQLDGAANLIRPRFLVDSQEAWKAPPLSFSLGAGLFCLF